MPRARVCDRVWGDAVSGGFVLCQEQILLMAAFPDPPAHGQRWDFAGLAEGICCQIVDPQEYEGREEWAGRECRTDARR